MNKTPKNTFLFKDAAYIKKMKEQVDFENSKADGVYKLTATQYIRILIDNAAELQKSGTSIAKIRINK
jgi:hypothetical protein